MYHLACVVDDLVQDLVQAFAIVSICFLEAAFLLMFFVLYSFEFNHMQLHAITQLVVRILQLSVLPQGHVSVARLIITCSVELTDIVPSVCTHIPTVPYTRHVQCTSASLLMCSVPASGHEDLCCTDSAGLWADPVLGDL